MFFAINYGCNKYFPQIYCVGATFDNVIQLIKNKVGADQEFKVYSDSATDDRPYEISDVEYKHIVSYCLSRYQVNKLRNGVSYYRGSMISIFESNDHSIDLAKVIDSLNII